MARAANFFWKFFYVFSFFLQATRIAVGVFREFLKETEQDENFERFEPEFLNQQLDSFYANARTKKGEFYKKNSFSSIRFGIARHLKMESDVDIIDDQRFRTSNMTYKAALVELKRIGKGSVDHHPEITPQDLKKLYDSFKTDSAVELQEKVLFDIIYYLCRRGRENLRDMSKDTFAIWEKPMCVKSRTN